MLLVNGQERMKRRSGAFFSSAMPYLRLRGASPAAGIYFYPFCVDPTSRSYTGALNFSQVDNAVLALSWKGADPAKFSDLSLNDAPLDAGTMPGDGAKLQELLIFATNYNIINYDGKGQASLQFA